MCFVGGFSKIAFVSKHTDEALVRATPKKHGGKTGSGRYFLRYHPKEKRWSCTCPDWIIRRKSLGSDYKKHHDCKHITAHKAKSKAWLVKEKMPKYPHAEIKKLREEAATRDS